MIRVAPARRSLASLAALTLVAACAPDVAVSQSSSSLVLDATASAEPRAVVAIDRGMRGGLCTGVLVAPRVVLTAKHCAQLSGESRPLPPNELTVRVTAPSSTALSDHDERVEVVAIRTTAGPWRDSLSGPLGLAGRDLAVLELARPTSATPASFALDFVRRESIGAAVTVVGFGADSRGALGVRRVGHATVRAIVGDELRTGPLGCDGDSGAPMLDARGRVVAILSQSSAPCGEGETLFSGLSPIAEELAIAFSNTGAPVETVVDAATAPAVSTLPTAPTPRAQGCGVALVAGTRRPSDRGAWLALVSVVALSLTRRRACESPTTP